MTYKEICECIYKSLLGTLEGLQDLVNAILQVFKWVFLVMTTPLWLIPYTIFKKNEKDGFDNGKKENQQ